MRITYEKENVIIESQQLGKIQGTGLLTLLIAKMLQQDAIGDTKETTTNEGRILEFQIREEKDLENYERDYPRRK